MRLRRVDLLEDGDGEGGGLSSAVLCACEDVASCECDRDGLLLDGRGALEACLEDAHQERPLEEVVFELVAFCRKHVLPIIMTQCPLPYLCLRTQILSRQL